MKQWKECYTLLEAGELSSVFRLPWASIVYFWQISSLPSQPLPFNIWNSREWFSCCRTLIFPNFALEIRNQEPARWLWVGYSYFNWCNFSVRFSHPVVSNSLQPYEPQHARPPCPSPAPRVHPNPCRSSRWCHPTISSSVVPFSSCPQSFLTSGSFQMSQLFAWGGQSIGVSASTSVLPMNTQDWFPLGWTGWM